MDSTGRNLAIGDAGGDGNFAPSGVALFGGIARALAARGREPGAYRQILARYERGPGGRLHLRVESAIARDGRREPLPLLFDLRSLVRA